MIVFGLHSSIFDFITFYILYFYFKLSGAPFQTGWFLESAITELLILYIIRTRKSFIKSKPGKWLLITGIIAFCITIYLPVSPFVPLLGFSVAHTQQLVAILIILVNLYHNRRYFENYFFQNKCEVKKRYESKLIIKCIHKCSSIPMCNQPKKGKTFIAPRNIYPV